MPIHTAATTAATATAAAGTAAVAARAAAARGPSRSGGSRGTLRPAADVNWQPVMTCAFPGLDSYALLLVLVYVATASNNLF